MPQLSFVTLDVFTRTRFAGNPLAVVLIPIGQDPQSSTLQTIAREFNLSETVFLYLNEETASQDVPEWRVRIFMTEAELPFAGHPTIGTACYALETLAKGKRKARLLCNAGSIELEYADGVARAQIPHNVHVHRETSFARADVRALQPKLKDDQLLAIEVASPVKGMNFVYVELPDLEALALVETSGFRPQPKLDKDWDVGFIGSVFYVLGDKSRPADGGAARQTLRMRMIEGTLEDPATGSAACGLGALLTLKAGQREVSYGMTQGVEMGRQSDIGVAVEMHAGLGGMRRIELSGSSVQVMEGTVSYD